MSCACKYGYDNNYGYGEAIIWTERRVNAARKPHRCTECGCRIAVGERCCRASSLLDGKWLTEYRCATCSAIAELVADINEACPLWGMLRETCDDMPEVDWHRLRSVGLTRTANAAEAAER